MNTDDYLEESSTLSFKGCTVTLISVSYTHLDVYKRQPQRRTACSQESSRDTDGRNQKPETQNYNLDNNQKKAICSPKGSADS